jgi:hypothetical protein
MHWLEVLNSCETFRAALGDGASRCNERYFGRDLPAYRPEDSTVCLCARARVCVCARA